MFAVHDDRALIVLPARRGIGLRVPEAGTVIGSDNNGMLCELMVCKFSTPTLASVSVNPYRLGYEAARWLNQLMEGKIPGRDPLLIDPSEVASRTSTDVHWQGGGSATRCGHQSGAFW